MTTSKWISLGLGSLTVLLVVLMLSMGIQTRSLRSDMEAVASIDHVRHGVTLAMQSKVRGYVLELRAMLMNEAAQEAAALEALALQQALADYQRLAVTPQQQDMARRFAEKWQALEGVGQTVGTRPETPAPPALSELGAALELQRRLDVLIEQEMQTDALQSYHARRSATAADLQRSAMLALLLLGLGLAIALGTSWRVGRRLMAVEGAIKSGAEQLHAMLSSIGDAVITADRRACVMALNPVAERLTGWTQAEASGKPIDEVCRLIGEATHEPVDHPALRALREGRSTELVEDALLVARDGSKRPVDDSAAPVGAIEGGIDGVVLVFRDISARKIATEELRRSDRRKSEFLATLAHELRNPLAPIRTALEIIDHAGVDTQTRRAALGTLQRQVAQMVRMVDDLLDVSRVERGIIELRRRRVDLAELMQQAVQTARPACERLQHSLSLTLPEGPIHVEADPGRLAQALGNLLDNACKFTRSPGGRIELMLERQAQQALIRVRDNGVGISADQMPRIFDLFMQVDTSLERSTHGLGIGLSLVRTLVELHGGSVQAVSAGTDCGSEFIIRLPALASVPAMETLPASPSGSSPAAVGPRRVLVVDNNHDAVASMEMLLQLEGHATRGAHDGLQALEAAQAFNPEIVLLDIGLPGLNGYDVARRPSRDRRTDRLVSRRGPRAGPDLRLRRTSRQAGRSGAVEYAAAA
jgi:PAS domain S-box-containing protein